MNNQLEKEEGSGGCLGGIGWLFLIFLTLSLGITFVQSHYVLASILIFILVIVGIERTKWKRRITSRCNANNSLICLCNHCPQKLEFPLETLDTKLSVPTVKALRSCKIQKFRKPKLTGSSQPSMCFMHYLL